MFDINAIVNAAITEAVNARITEVLQQHANTVAALAERVAALETKLTEAALFAQTTNVTIPIDEAKMVEALNDQEWFWEKMQRFAAGAAEAAMDDHTSTYDHDEYDSHIGDDDKHFDGDIEDAVRDAIGNLTFEVSVS